MDQNIDRMLHEINSLNKKVNIMEVCGTHTMSICKNGIRDIITENINLISGPGCPVCVTDNGHIDYIFELALKENIIITTYGDMIRVPGSDPSISLIKAKSSGADVRIIYSSIDAVEIAVENPDKLVVFLGIGFETTIPATAAAILEAHKLELDNFKVFSVHKLVKPVMEAVLSHKDLKIDGFIIPGHVATIIGEKGFEFLEKYNCFSSIVGFRGEEVIYGLFQMIQNIKNDNKRLGNAYKSLASKEGNIAAVKIYNEIFEPRDDVWRGIGKIPNSGMKLKEKWSKYDIEKLYPYKEENKLNKSPCKCGEVLIGKIKPKECPLFGKICNPINPVGPCMVSSEGSCAAYYKYNS
ncbi:hydrogenase formation protein HypD [Oceanirhabdus sp. W0125-5]|uniref:hydrogenase formation protein HypD n=1 Tax=Oceanirhabdus sp. W0125-5 TaxID=2999116 RepID=UPI0022F2F699|nr:hydrogenase formation protein HypD [Oceanirhabdus sp. W0125-5]WBW95399.1 hydrogenase formation protein HypD [Oceanirhabdus sp. W0125-5]